MGRGSACFVRSSARLLPRCMVDRNVETFTAALKS
jgi:hypothetical protein